MTRLEVIQHQVRDMDEALVLCKIAEQRKRMAAINAVLEEEELIYEVYKVRLEYLDKISPENCWKHFKL
jgi:hypothetical protein